MPTGRYRRRTTCSTFAELKIPAPPDLIGHLHPFTRQVIEMDASPTRCAVFVLAKGQPLGRAAGHAGTAMTAARKRDSAKEFVARRIKHKGAETFAVWRTK